VTAAGGKRARYQKATARLKRLMRLVRHDAAMTLRVQRKIAHAQREVQDAKAQLRSDERLGPASSKMGRHLVRRARIALHSATVVASGGELKFGHKHGRRLKRVRGRRRSSFDTSAHPTFKSLVHPEHPAFKAR